MNQQIKKLGGTRQDSKLAGGPWLAGAMDNKTVFIIICVVAIGVAVIALGSFFWGGSGSGFGKTPNWQCLKCDYKFFDPTVDEPPIECPKCQGEAVRLSYRTCAKCRKKTLVSRIRLTEEAATRYRELKAQGRAPVGMQMIGWPRETQLRVQQADGSYGWTDWMPANAPEVREIRAGMTCPKCGENLYKYRTPAR